MIYSGSYKRMLNKRSLEVRFYLIKKPPLKICLAHTQHTQLKNICDGFRILHYITVIVLHRDTLRIG